MNLTSPDVRKGMPDVEIGKEEFDRRYREQFFDPAFCLRDVDIEAIADIAIDGCKEGSNASVTVKPGPGFIDSP